MKISSQLFTNNLAGVTYANGRDHNFVPNQNAEVDILTGSADPFTASPSDIVSVLYGPGTDLGDIPNPWTSYSDTLSLAAGAYQLRFAETDNQGFLQMGVDNVSVSLMTGVPEASTRAMLLMGVWRIR